MLEEIDTTAATSWRHADDCGVESIRDGQRGEHAAQKGELSAKDDFALALSTTLVSWLERHCRSARIS